MKKLFLSLSLLAFFTTAYAQTESHDEGKKEEFPAITLKDMDGQEVDLKALANSGKVTIVSFWATWCSPCKKELENMNELIDDWKEKYDVQLVAISIDDSRNAMKVKPYVNGRQWDFTVLLDVNQDTKRSLNYPNVPYTLLVDKEGNIVYKHTGYTEGDEYVLEEKIASLK